MKTETSAVDINRSIGDFAYPEVHVRDAGTGLSERTIHYIADVKEDPDWVREFRLRGLKTFLEKPLPTHWAWKRSSTAKPSIQTLRKQSANKASFLSDRERG